MSKSKRELLDLVDQTLILEAGREREFYNGSRPIRELKPVCFQGKTESCGLARTIFDFNMIIPVTLELRSWDEDVLYCRIISSSFTTRTLFI